MDITDIRTKKTIIALLCMGLVLQAGGIVASIRASDYALLEKPLTGYVVTDADSIQKMSLTLLIISSFVGSTIIMILLYKKLETILTLASQAKTTIVKEIKSVGEKQSEELSKTEEYYTDEMKEIVATRNMLMLKYLENEKKQKKLSKKL